MRRLSEHGPIACLIEKTDMETQAEQYSDTVSRELPIGSTQATSTMILVRLRLLGDEEKSWGHGPKCRLEGPLDGRKRAFSEGRKWGVRSVM